MKAVYRPCAEIIVFLCHVKYYMRFELAVVFFFQAEDGIRDLVRSRGLGDVYKRQASGSLRRGEVGLHVTDRSPQLLTRRATGPAHRNPVSYTHLTLPTSDLV